MKNLLTLLIVFSSFIAAEEYKYEPVANKAEYYSGQFNKGKDMDDLLSWGEKFVEWMEDKSAWDPMETVVFSPYFSDDMQRADYVWLNLWPSAGEQYAAIDQWLKEGGSMLRTLPVTNQRVVDVWQWPISSPDGEIGDFGFVRFTECTLKEGITMRKAFDTYKDLAKKAKSTGDNMGRKMIMAPTGAGEYDYDYVYSLYANTPADFGKNVDNFGENLRGTPEVEALGDIAVCDNGRSYSTVRIKAAN